jgi:glycosyltransferase involved in cell wall biosynthesis
MNASLEERFIKNKVCVVLPTYNNAGTVSQVIDDLLQYTTQILVINDGSTDHTREILKRYSHLKIHHFDINKGKGTALRFAFKEAYKQGYEYAITIDSDGQHFAKDLIHFLDKLETEKNTIIIGSRNMTQENVPGTSSFGNKFSNFWFELETGIKVPDTQSGYRLYPLASLDKLFLFTWRYEFEVEVIVKAAWNFVNVICIPIEVYYPPADERISHFRKGPDFTRISFLNSYLVIMAFLWYKPRNFFLNFKSNMKKFWQEQIIASHESNQVKSLSVGFGLFMGIFPIWGFQMLVAGFLAHWMKLNKVIVLASSNISIPINIPWIIFCSIICGKLALGNSLVEFSIVKDIEDVGIKVLFTKYGFEYFIGAAIFASIMAIGGYLITSFSLMLIRKERSA